MQQFIADYGYLAVFVLMLAEAACIPVPSELTMPLGGALAAGAVAGAHTSLVGIIVAGLAGNVAGSYLAWALGRYGGQAAWHRCGRYLRLHDADLARTERWFRRYGAAAVFFGRLLPVVRTFISLPAGIGAMPPARFGVYTLVGCVPWTAALAAAGYALGSHWHTVAAAFHGPTLILAAVVAVLILTAAVVFWLRRRRAPTPSTARSSPNGQDWPTEILPKTTEPTQRLSLPPGRAGTAGTRRRPAQHSPAPAAGTRIKAGLGGGLLLGLLALGALALTGPVTRTGLHVDQAVVGVRSPTLTGLAVGLTGAAQETVGLVLLLLGAGMLWLRKRRWDATRLITVAGTAWILALALKYAFNRPRPPSRLWLIPPDASGSFPSGHTTTAAVVVIIVSLSLLGLRRLRGPTTLAALLYALAVGASRIYLGDHYPLDVAGSYLTVAAAALLIAAITDLAPLRRAARLLHIPAIDPDTTTASASPRHTPTRHDDPEAPTLRLPSRPTPISRPQPQHPATTWPERAAHHSDRPRPRQRW